MVEGIIKTPASGYPSHPKESLLYAAICKPFEETYVQQLTFSAFIPLGSIK